ncbi:hypothetical protein DFH09DRAFT_1313693 [Mycena vulgaris]|nr:hypothetical protein DFH09DRAFT_1313693 [Mycena vulgaris]
MPCSPPFYPSPGHKHRLEHDRSVACVYYFVHNGTVRGTFTNLWIARTQVEGVSNGFYKAAKTWDEGMCLWNEMCAEKHRHGCPPCEPITFSLVPDPRTQPRPPPCLPYPRASATAGPSPASSVAPASPFPLPMPSAPVAPLLFAMPAGDSGASLVPIAGTSFLGWTHVAAPSFGLPCPAPSPFSMPSVKTESDPASPTLKKQEPLTPTGHAAASTLMGTPPPIGSVRHSSALSMLSVSSVGLSMSSASSLTTSSAPSPQPRAPLVTPTMPVPAAAPRLPSLLATPNPAAVGVAAPAPAPPQPLTRHIMYGVRGVGVFYDSYTSARAAATHLGIEDPKIMIMSDAEKLEAWITGKPFVGEDEQI